MDLSGATVAELNAELLGRTASLQSLDRLFVLPEWVSDPELREAYEIIVARLRNEIEHVPLSTLQQLRVERIAFNYIVLKFRESLAANDFAFAEHLKDWNTYWAQITREFDTVARAWKPTEKEAIMAVVRSAVGEILATVQDTEIRNDLIQRFVATFERAGLTK